MIEPIADITDDGELLIDWKWVTLMSLDFDAGHRDDNAALGKILTLIRRNSFEEGFLKGCATDRVEATAWLAMNETKGNA